MEGGAVEGQRAAREVLDDPGREVARRRIAAPRPGQSRRVSPEGGHPAADAASIAPGPVSVHAASFVRMTTTPDVIARYYTLRRPATSTPCSTVSRRTPTSSTRDVTTTVSREIRRWRESVASRFTYTTEITKAERRPAMAAAISSTHPRGDFPGGVVDLDQRFTLVDGLIVDLAI